MLDLSPDNIAKIMKEVQLELQAVVKSELESSLRKGDEEEPESEPSEPSSEGSDPSAEGPPAGPSPR